MGSNRGRILDIDLAKRSSKTTHIKDDLLRKFVGGSGLAARLFLDRVPPNADPLSGKNILFLMAGPLSGTRFPTSSRLVAAFKSPLTGIWGQGSCGGDSAAQLKAAGYDGVAISGSSKKPVYILVEDDRVEIKDASDIWGKDTYETTQILKKRHGAKADILEIGPAGENLVKFASIMNGEWGSISRCGGGAVMGSKKLKALVLRGTGKVEPALPEEFEKVRKAVLEKIKQSVVTQALTAAGTAMGVEVNAITGVLPVKNYTVGDGSYLAPKLSGNTISAQYLTRPHACFTCPIACKRTVKVAEGPYRVGEGPGPQYETVCAFGSLMLIDHLAAVIRLGEMANRYGMDTISCGATIAFAMECFEKGLITTRDLRGDHLRWGNPEDVLAIMAKIAYRQGFGDILAEGSRSAARRIGNGAERFTVEVKGLEFALYDVRGSHGHGLGFVMSNRGACHVASEIGKIESSWTVWPEIGVTGGYDPKADAGKGELNVICENVAMLSNATTMCQFALMSMAITELAEALKAATGFDYTLDEIMQCGARIWMLQRGLNNLMGITSADDRMPERILTPHTEGGAAGSVPDIKLMLKDYYRYRGLRPDGRPSQARLRSLGLSPLAAKLQSCNLAAGVQTPPGIQCDPYPDRVPPQKPVKKSENHKKRPAPY
ncbi:MAG: aldehyde ferredoxin oxidoreductase family protein [Dehalococcoidia bacterium]|nr:aldehyde ferredoxin oxidoreductase family protein [Dehalococcoidia bacterium]